MGVSKYKRLSTRLRGLLENKSIDDDKPDNPKEMLMEIIEAYKEARKLTDDYLYDDHISWLKNSFNKGWFEFPDDYDFNASRWSLGLMIAQVERYGGIVMDTKKGTLPVSLDHPIKDQSYRITEKE
jgi:hypothetical protein|tara:strand:- start:441 stop:818 length:378 start_codon:yes stop_codon:yes gene_type:complete